MKHGDGAGPVRGDGDPIVAAPFESDLMCGCVEAAGLGRDHGLESATLETDEICRTENDNRGGVDVDPAGADQGDRQTSVAGSNPVAGQEWEANHRAESVEIPLHDRGPVDAGDRADECRR